VLLGKGAVRVVELCALVGGHLADYRGEERRLLLRRLLLGGEGVDLGGDERPEGEWEGAHGVEVLGGCGCGLGGERRLVSGWELPVGSSDF